MPPPVVKRDIHGRILNDKGRPTDSFGRELDDFDRPKDDRIIREPDEIEAAGCSNVLIAYPAFGDWVAMYDPRKNRGFSRDHASYLEFKARFQKQITSTLREISGRAVGRIILSELCASSFTLRIFPIEFVDSLAMWIKYHTNAIQYNDDRASAVALGMHAGQRNSTTNGVKTSTNVKGTGTGSDARIFFTPGRVRAGRPGSNADETLLHEMVHAVRGMSGVNTQAFKMSGRWDNQEEFSAVTVENVYLSEKKQTALRANHGHDVMKDPKNFLDSPDVPAPGARGLVGNIRHRQPRMFAALAALGPSIAEFNPFRQLAEETKKAMAAHNAKMQTIR